MKGMNYFHEALRRTVLVGKIALLIITGAVAAFVHRLAEEPRRPQLFVERNERGETGDLVKEIEQCLHHVIGLNRATGHIYDRQSGF